MKDNLNKVIFSSIVRPIVSSDKDKYLALASLKELKQFIPEMDLDVNRDLLPIAFNAFVANRVNKNGHALLGKDAVETANLFINKPINIEHNRKAIVGVIVTASFSEFGSDNPLDQETAIKMTAPFNVTLGGLIWRVANPNLIDLLESSNDPDSEYYLKISASWEMCFNEYNILLIENDSKNVEDGRIITDPKELNTIKAKMRKPGQNIDENTRAYLIPATEILPLGIGLTDSPAADVRGIATSTEYTEPQDDTDTAAVGLIVSDSSTSAADINPTIVYYTKVDDSTAIATPKGAQQGHSVQNPLNTNNISQTQKKNVNANSSNTKVMKITSLDEITDDVLKEIKASELTNFFTDELKKKSEEFANQIVEKEKLVTENKRALDELKATHESLTLKFETVQKELDQIKAAQLAKQKEEEFSGRMASFDEKYDLTAEDRQIIAQDIRDLDTEAYAAYTKKMDVLLKNKIKAAKTEVTANTQDPNTVTTNAAVVNNDEKAETKTETATTETVVVNAVDQSKVQQSTVPNVTTTARPTLKEEYAEAFSLAEGFIVKGLRKK